MLPLEVWQEVLGFCPCEEYVSLINSAASREFYSILKDSLLEMRFCVMLPSAWLGGMWEATRSPAARCVRKLRLGGRSGVCVFLGWCVPCLVPHVV